MCVCVCLCLCLCLCVCVCVCSDLPGARVFGFTRCAIIEELSIRRRLHTFLTSCGQKTRVKHCYVDLSSWYELWLAIIFIDLSIWTSFSIFLPQSINFRDGFAGRFRLPGSTQRIFFYWNTTTWNNSSTDVSLLMTNVKIKCEYFYIPRPAGVKPHGSPQSWLRNHLPCQHSGRAAIHHTQKAYLTAIFGHYIRGYFNN